MNIHRLQAQICGLNIVVHAVRISFSFCLIMNPDISVSSAQEELLGIIREYERRGYFDEIMALLEAGLSLERAHVSLIVLFSP